MNAQPSHPPPLADSELPSGFEQLEPFIGWALESEAEQSERRYRSSFADIKAFYDTILPKMAEALALLEGATIEQMSPQLRRLFLLTLSFAEIAGPVEQFQAVHVPDTFADASRLKAIHHDIRGMFRSADKGD